MEFKSVLNIKITFLVDVFFQSIIFYTSSCLTLNPLQFLIALSSSTFTQIGNYATLGSLSFWISKYLYFCPSS